MFERNNEGISCVFCYGFLYWHGMTDYKQKAKIEDVIKNVHNIQHPEEKLAWNTIHYLNWDSYCTGKCIFKKKFCEVE